MKSIRSLLIASLPFLIISCGTEKKQERIDHVILAVGNLETGMNQFEALTGVKPVVGGIHPNSYTQNALVSLGNQTYLEILAPRTDLDSIPEWILNLDSLTPYRWAVGTDDISSSRNKLRAAGATVSDPHPGSRKTPAGDLLEWTTFGIETNDSPAIPFFISWGKGTMHPSKTTPGGCTLDKLQLFSNDPVLSALSGLPRLEIMNAPESKMVLVLDCPKGKIIL